MATNLFNDFSGKEMENIIEGVFYMKFYKGEVLKDQD